MALQVYKMTHSDSVG